MLGLEPRFPRQRLHSNIFRSATLLLTYLAPVRSLTLATLLVLLQPPRRCTALLQLPMRWPGLVPPAQEAAAYLVCSSFTFLQAWH